MLSAIRKNVFAEFKKSDIHWAFLSIFDKNNNLLMSNGSIMTDKNLNSFIETLYKWTMQEHEKKIDLVVCDIVTDINQETDMQKIISTDMSEFGVFIWTIDSTASGVILPNTEGIADMKQALSILRKKHSWITGNINVSLFKTRRIVCYKND